MNKHMKVRNRRKFNKANALLDLGFILVIFLTIISFYVALLIRGQKSTSIAENRALNKLPAFKLSEFFSGDYQTKLEDAMTDQMIFGEKIKKEMTRGEAETVSSVQKALMEVYNYGENEKSEEVLAQDNIEEKPKEVRNIKYIPISGGVYYYGNSNYMVFKSKNLEKNKELIDKWAKEYNKYFSGMDSYFYLVNTSKSIDFNTVDETENEFVTYIRSVLDFKGVTGLKVSSYEQYKDYFYETDHHWNYKGSYQGYRDIISMMLPEDELIEPKDTVTYDVYYYGSNARTTSVYKNKEKFTVYEFDLPHYNTRINGSYARYDNHYLYENNKYSREEGYNHYGAYYGGDYAEVIYEYDQPEKENLFIIAPSYSNANNNLIASHFNKTYVIDLRHYKNTFEKDFDPEAYCKKNNITKVLVMLSIDHITNGKFILK